MPRATGSESRDPGDGSLGSSDEREEFAPVEIGSAPRLAEFDEDTHNARCGDREEAEEGWRRFVADLRSALAAIRDSFADRLSDPNIDREALAADLRRAREQTVRAEILVRDLVLLGDLTRGSPLAMAETDVSALVNDLVVDARVTAPTRTITLSAEERVVAEIDAGTFARAVENLLANASQHTPDGTPIEVAVWSGDGEVLVEVIDHGPGFDLAVQDELLDRYVSQVASGSATDGWGLGLLIAATVASAHGGRCTVRPTNGGGATFAVTVHARQATQPRSFGASP